MEKSKHRLQRAGSAAFVFATVMFVVLAILWPVVVADIFRSRWVLSLLTAWSVGSAILLHPEISANLARGFREFSKATKEIAREIGGDDDDGPHAA